MPAIQRDSNNPYSWSVAEANLAEVANVEKKLPEDYITADGFGITDKAKQYLSPLIQGEDYPPYKNGLPDYVVLKNILVDKKLTNSFEI
jgi:6-phosphofructokinase 1